MNLHSIPAETYTTLWWRRTRYPSSRMWVDKTLRMCYFYNQTSSCMLFNNGKNLSITGCRSTSINQQTSIESSPAEINRLDAWQNRTLWTRSLQTKSSSSSSYNHCCNLLIHTVQCLYVWESVHLFVTDKLCTLMVYLKYYTHSELAHHISAWVVNSFSLTTPQVKKRGQYSCQ